MHQEIYPAFETDLMNKIVRKDTSAFGRLYDRYSQVVFNLAMRILKNRGEAEELVQEVFLQVWNKAYTYDSNRGSITTWIINIARNLGIDKLRKKKDLGNYSDIEDEQISSNSDSLRILEEEEQRMVIVEAMEGLPVEQRTAIEMVYYSGLTHAEIAARLNEPIGTVKTRIKLGIAKLRKQLSSKMDK